MIIYEVNIEVEPSVVEEYRAWLDQHIEEILLIDGFDYAIWSVDVEGEGTRFVVHYYLRDRASLDRYLEEHAPRLREDGVQRFGARFSARRRVMEIVREYAPKPNVNHT
jgi:hypothetical protein